MFSSVSSTPSRAWEAVETSAAEEEGEVDAEAVAEAELLPEVAEAGAEADLLPGDVEVVPLPVDAEVEAGVDTVLPLCPPPCPDP